MKKDRLRARISDVRDLGRAVLQGKKMVFNKPSKDGSSKANLTDESDGEVWGALYELSTKSLERLDRIEGGYDRETVHVLWKHKSVPAYTYISSEKVEAKPTESYKNSVVEGAREHDLPNDYIKYLQGLPSKPDPQKS